MGSSFTKSRGHGFWTRDPLLEVWLRVLANEVDRLPSVPTWLRTARTNWHIQATSGFNGFVSAGLDETLTDAERSRFVEGLCVAALARLRQAGPLLSCDYLNRLMEDPASGYATDPATGEFTRDAEAYPFLRVGECFLALVRGQLDPTDENSPMVGMEQHPPSPGDAAGQA
jgi:hypothetical protein